MYYGGLWQISLILAMSCFEISACPWRALAVFSISSRMRLSSFPFFSGVTNFLQYLNCEHFDERLGSGTLAHAQWFLRHPPPLLHQRNALFRGPPERWWHHVVSWPPGCALIHFCLGPKSAYAIFQTPPPTSDSNRPLSISRAAMHSSPSLTILRAQRSNVLIFKTLFDTCIFVALLHLVQ